MSRVNSLLFIIFQVPLTYKPYFYILAKKVSILLNLIRVYNILFMNTIQPHGNWLMQCNANKIMIHESVDYVCVSFPEENNSFT